jgi:lipoprotein-anchoring transpeptidase ErfK/SrfK
MVRFSGALLLALPVAAAFGASSALAQYTRSPPAPYYEERLPPVIGGLDDEDLNPPPRRARPGQRGPSRALPYPDDDEPLPPPTGLFGAPDRRPPGYGYQTQPPPPQQPPAYGYRYQTQPPQAQQPPPAGAPSRAGDPDAMRPPASIGVAPQGPPPSVTAALPPDYQPETGQPKELSADLKKQLVDFSSKEPAGTIVIDTAHTHLYLVLGGGKALRYGIGVGRDGFTWAGTERISKMSEWPDWHPPSEMIDRQPYLPRFMAGGPGNPLGARALYLGKTLYRIHGTNQPSTIGTFVSSGCIRLINEDVEDLFSRVQVGTRVVVLPGRPPDGVANTGPQPAANGLAPAGAPAVAAPNSVPAQRNNASAMPNTVPAPRSNSTSSITSSPLPPVR